MKNYADAKGKAKNLEYYSKEIAKLCRSQFDEDLQKYDPRSQELTYRLDLIGAIENATTQIIYWKNVIDHLLESAKIQDAKLGIITEEEE